MTCLLAAVRSTAANGTGVDTANYGSAMAVVNVGAPGDALSGSVYAELELQDADADTGYASCAAADLTDPATGSMTGCFAKLDGSAGNNGSAIYKTGYRGSKRWLRVVWNKTGTHTVGTPASATIVLGQPKSQPVS